MNRLLILFVCAVAPIQDVRACVCSFLKLDGQLQNSSSAFVARVVYADHRKSRAELEILRTFKGEITPGTQITVDPASNTDCIAELPNDGEVLVFLYEPSSEVPEVDSCSVYLSRRVTVDGRVRKPWPETLAFIRQQRAR